MDLIRPSRRIGRANGASLFKDNRAPIVPFRMHKRRDPVGSVARSLDQFLGRTSRASHELAELKVHAVRAVTGRGW